MVLNFVKLETPRLEGSDGSMGAGASAPAHTADVQTGLARLGFSLAFVRRICEEG